MIVLDTHAWIWWATEDRQLSPPARRRIDASGTLGICSISLWEVAMLVERGRLELDRDVLEWIDEACALPKVEVIDLTPEIAVRSTRLGSQFHRDPADQLIVASALERRAALVTRDERIRSFGGVESVW
jgi:PIN domain nuclease of toxin-antitoxin system